MKHRLLFTLLLGGMAVAASAQTVVADLTSKLTNADFMADSPVQSTIYTYDYNMTDDGLGAGGTELFGMQPVTGWTANTPSDNIKVMQSDKDPAREDGANARAAGVFAYENDASETFGTIGLGGNYFAPYGTEGQVLGFVAVWGAAPTYSQEVTLEAGAYMLVYKIANTAGTGSITNLNGFVAGEKQYLSTKETYPVDDDEFVLDSVVFQLDATTTGNVQIGFSFGGGSGSAPHLFYDCVNLYKIDQNELIQKEIQAKKAELLDLINTGKAYGVSTSAAQAVYDNPNATLAQVEEAIANQKALNETGVVDLSEFFITNPHFDVDDPVVGGICTYDYDCEKNNIPTTNYSMLPCTGWERTKTDNGCAAGVYAVGSDAFLGGVDFKVPTTMSDGSTEGKVLGLVTCWTMTVQYKQEVTLPAGQYTISMSYYNAGGTTAITKNLIGFVADNGTEYLGTNTTFPVGKWTAEEVKFTLNEETTGYFTMGYASPNVGSAKVPHFFTDGFALQYVGQDIDPSMMALVAAVATGKKFEDALYQASMKEQFDAALEEAQALIDAESKDAAANKAATEAITSMIADVKASIAAYEDLKTFFDGKFQDVYAKYEGTDLQGQLDAMSDEIAPQLEKEDATWSVDEINEKINSLDGIIKAYVQQKFDEAVATGESDGDLDISVLYGDLLGATYSSSALSGSSVVDKQWEYGDAGNFKTQYGTMEVWNQSPFKVSQTMKNMPAGTYTLSTRAFYRTADQVSSYDAYIADPSTSYAYVFAGNLKTPLANIAEIASADQEEFSASNTAVDSDTKFVPNSQQAAYNVFENKYRNYDETTYKSVKTVLTSEGDLTFGVMADQMLDNSWVVWYTFELQYNPVVDETLVDEELAAVINELDEYLSNHSNEMTSVTSESAADVKDKATEAQEGSLEEKSAAVTSVKAALDDAKANVAAFTAMAAAYDKLIAAAEEYSATASKAAINNYNAVQDKYDGYDAMTTEELEALTKEITRAAALLRIPDYSEPPTDFTPVIDNPGFETGDLTGWSYYAGSDTGAKDVTNSTYLVENAEGAYLFNTWNGSAPEGGFYITQTLYSLPSGKYTLSALLAASKDSKITMKAGSKSAEFTMANEQTIGQTESIIFNLQEESDVEIRVESPTWFKCDNFQLTYEGEAEPDLKGDVNEDGAVNINDVVAIINVMAGTASWPNANVNGDPEGAVDINDVVAVINIMAGKE